jgi:hypothetical protein
MGTQKILDRMAEAFTEFNLLFIPDTCSQHVQLENPHVIYITV